MASSHSLRPVGPGPGASPHRVAPLPPASRPRVGSLARASCRPWRKVGSASRPQWAESPVCKAQSPLEKAPVAPVAFPVAPVACSQLRHSRSKYRPRPVVAIYGSMGPFHTYIIGTLLRSCNKFILIACYWCCDRCHWCGRRKTNRLDPAFVAWLCGPDPCVAPALALVVVLAWPWL